MTNNTETSSARPIRRSYVVAGVIFLLLCAWVISGQFAATPRAPGAATEANAAGAGTPDRKASSEKGAAPLVRVQTIKASPRRTEIVIRGQSQALRKVMVRAETAGKVAAIRADKGRSVRKGDVICELNVDERLAMLKQARAVMKQKRLEADASRQLLQKGFRSETALAGDEAEYEAAKAQSERMEKELENTRLRAPFDGLIDQRMADVGDYLAPGQPCALVIDQDPFLVVGQVSERNVGDIRVGGRGWAKLVTGERVEGRIRFVATSADEATRTFRVELEVANPKGIIRDGVTAEMHVIGAEVLAQRISPSILSLNEKGTIGVRIVGSDKKVKFVPVKIVAETAEGMWVEGLPSSAMIITVGQDFVSVGQTVRVFEERVSQL